MMLRKCPRCKRRSLHKSQVSHGVDIQTVWRCIGVSNTEGCGYHSENGKKGGTI